MVEFLELCFTSVNLPFTILLILVFFYWVFFIVGAVGLDSLDLDFDAVDLDADVDVDVDMDAHLDAHGGAHAGHSSGMLVSMLRFFNVGDVPLMIWATFFAFFLWAGAIMGSHYFNPELGFTVAAVTFIPNVIVSLFVTKLATAPFRLVFKHANAGIAAPIKIVGKTCVITTGTVTSKSGQAEIPQEGAPITLNVRSQEGQRLTKGMEAIVVEHDEEKNTYVVVPFNFEVAE